MRIASFNLENLFDRAKLLADPDWSTHKDLLTAYDDLTRVLQQDTYSDADKLHILALLDALGLKASDSGTYVVLRQNRGRLITRHNDGTTTVVANGRGDWVGWVELTRAAVTEVAVRNTARVVHDVGADVLGVVEAEGRQAMQRFNRDLLGQAGDWTYAHVMVIDGNDERGIDVGILTRADYPIASIVSHVDDTDATGPVFSRDCPEYHLTLPDGSDLLVLVNHLKSKGFGIPRESNALRHRQATRVAEIYRARRTEGVDRIVVLGDLNDTPDSAPLAPLLVGTDAAPIDLKDVSTHPTFVSGGWPGTYGTGNKGNKIDYILCSPAVYAAITACGVFRTGVWTASHPPRWPMYDTITRAQDAASDHAAVWVDVDLGVDPHGAAVNP